MPKDLTSPYYACWTNADAEKRTACMHAIYGESTATTPYGKVYTPRSAASTKLHCHETDSEQKIEVSTMKVSLASSDKYDENHISKCSKKKPQFIQLIAMFRRIVSCI
jgi:hypothetical protein